MYLPGVALLSLYVLSLIFFPKAVAAVVAIYFLYAVFYMLFLFVKEIWESPKISKIYNTYLSRKEFLKFVTECGGFVEDREIEKHVNRVGRKIIAAAGQKERSIRFFVVNEREIINAFACFPNLIVITRGQYEDCCTEDELAAILGHEVGHITLNKRAGWARKNLKECREDEYKADQLAVEFAKKAGYDPNAYAEYCWRTMGHAYRAGYSAWGDDSCSTHPPDWRRIIALNRNLTQPA